MLTSPHGQFAIAFLLALSLCGLAASVLRRMGIIDKPNARSSHNVPTVRGLGIGIVAAVCTAWILGGLATAPVVTVLMAAGLVLALVSFIDDMRPLSSGLRFLCHAGAAISVIATLGLSDHPLPSLPWLLAIIPVAFLFVAGYTNAFNFMDGINGIAGFQGTLTALASGLLLMQAGVAPSDPVVLAFCALSGACAGFLPHNFPRARGFMGDVASATLGFWLAACALWAAQIHGFWLLIPLSLLHANFILDTGITLVRRALRREKLSSPHREHFYQRLVRSGRTHASTTLMEALGVTATYTILATGFMGRHPCIQTCSVAAVLLLWLIGFACIERRFRASQDQAAH